MIFQYHQFFFYFKMLDKLFWVTNIKDDTRCFLCVFYVKFKKCYFEIFCQSVRVLFDLANNMLEIFK